MIWVVILLAAVAAVLFGAGRYIDKTARSPDEAVASSFFDLGGIVIALADVLLLIGWFVVAALR